MNSSRKPISSGLFWKLLERFGVQGVQFVVQIILARLLDPEHYGMLSIMIIFTTLANVFIQNGFNTALVQGKEVSEEDYSSVFWVSFGIAGILYAVIFFCAPLIATFYSMSQIVSPLRVLAIILFPGALNSVQVAKISRELNFKKVFVSNVAAIAISGMVGVTMAYMGAGLWALVGQSLANIFVSCIVMSFTASLKLRFRCNLSRVKTLFSFGWKLLVSSLIDTLYTDLNSLIIGKKYSSDMLGYYNKGTQFPHLIINSINGAVQSVMLPVLSAKQDEKEKAKSITRTSMMMSSYIIFPMMAGLAAVATPLITLLLTEKWLPCVPYLQIACITFAFYPIHTSNLQAINASGRSDIFLKLEIIKKIVSVALLVGALLIFDTPMAIAWAGAVGVPIGLFINAFPNKKLINYSYFEQMKDILPSLIISGIMGLTVWSLTLLGWHPFLTIFLQIALGVVVYITISFITRVEPFVFMWNAVKQKIKKQ
ncbi:MAG: lipopolysaccharide biosynthesis protein [Ruminococcaceae bacterium]|nr:lipopolysaccharide biosynthesis protein [Oscillospiraceae bacterium]